MGKDRVIYLHTQYLNQNLTNEELLEWQSVIGNPKNEMLLKGLMKETWEALKHSGVEDMLQARSDKMFLDIVEKPQFVERKKLWWSRIAVAASIIVAVVTGGYLYFQSPKILSDQTTVVNQQDIAPGKNGATLTLSNGKKIRLTDALNGKLAQEIGVTITKTADGQLIYQISENDGDANTVNELSTAHGETYRLRLPDGSDVWLNAASSIKYPANFANLKERKVFLTGEAYFEVAKDKTRPFIVNSQFQAVEVLGTHFNINAYANQRKIKTTLLEGSVKVSVLKKLSSAKEIKPNQVAIFEGNSINVEEVDAEESIAWKNGYFQFSGKTLEEAMQEVARWYNVEIIYKNEELRTRLLAGTISKYGKISTVLKTMELADALHFTIEGKKIIIE